MMNKMTNAFLISKIEKLEKGKYKLYFENGDFIWVYGYEIRGMNLEEGMYISEQIYKSLYDDIVGKRAKKRALHLLEKMDRTEQQLREKLLLSEYPLEVIDDAISYVKKFHYIDDARYAQNFTRYRKENLSRQQIKQKLMGKGVARETIDLAIEEEYDVDEKEHIRRLLEKKHFDGSSKDEGEFRRVYNYLLRRGFRSSDILKEMKCVGVDW